MDWIEYVTGTPNCVPSLGDCTGSSGSVPPRPAPKPANKRETTSHSERQQQRTPAPTEISTPQLMNPPKVGRKDRAVSLRQYVDAVLRHPVWVVNSGGFCLHGTSVVNKGEVSDNLGASRIKETSPSGRLRWTDRHKRVAGILHRYT